MQPCGSRSWLALGLVLAGLLVLLATLSLFIRAEVRTSVPSRETVTSPERSPPIGEIAAEPGTGQDSKPGLPEGASAVVDAGKGTSVENIAPASSSVTVFGRVLDDRTDEAVPALDVWLSRGAESEIVPTRADGSFESRRRFPRGILVASIRDLDLEIARGERDFDPAMASTEWTLRVRVGPTYPLIFEHDPPPALGSCTVRLVESARPSEIAGEIFVSPNDLSGKPALEGIRDREWPWTKLRPGALPWIRYPTVLWLPDERVHPHLEVCVRSSGFNGVASAASTVGVQPPAKIEGRADYGELSGQIVLSPEPIARHRNLNGNLDSSGACVLLLPPSTKADNSSETPMWHEAWPDESGSFSFQKIEPGRWKLLAYASEHRIVEQEVSVPAGILKLDPIRLPRSAEDGIIELRAPENTLEWSSGRTFVRLRLSAAGVFARAWLEPWSENAFPEAHLWNLPAADFDLAEIAVCRSPFFRPFTMSIKAPQEALDLETVRPEEESDVDFEVRRADTGARVDPFEVSFGPSGSISGRPEPRAGRRWKIAKDAAFTWSVWSSGFAPVFGDEKSLHDTSDGRVARVDMSPGWGVSLLFRAGNPGTFADHPWPWNSDNLPDSAPFLGPLVCPPLKNVRVHIASDQIVVSDEGGEARIALRERPPRLQLLCAGWKLVHLEPVLGLLPESSQRYIVWMERE